MFLVDLEGQLGEPQPFLVLDVVVVDLVGARETQFGHPDLRVGGVVCCQACSGGRSGRTRPGP